MTQQPVTPNSPYAFFSDASADLVQSKDSTNAYDIHCPVCKCKILKKGVAKKTDMDASVRVYLSTTVFRPRKGLTHVFFVEQIELHLPPSLSTSVPLVPAHTWTVTDMMAFENVGFTKPVPGAETRYLSCADCDLGPIGYHPAPDVATGEKIYVVAADRVRYNIM
ncbi:hypothetical protein HKX48_005695 [Thoreauomyces humboldtii]|nr:hypothetical protein HKX48_005695 [Thoreauomyces humboldtii]